MEVITENNNRYYLTKDNIKLISVTSLVSKSIVSYGLELWKLNTSQEVQDSYKEIGNAFHKEIEKYYLKDCISDKLDGYVLTYLKELKLSDVKTEVPFNIRNSLMGYGGTVDCLASFNNEKVVVDWKTTKKKKYHSNLLNYFLQLSAYCKAFKREKGMVILNNYTKQEFNTYTLTSKELNFYYEYFSKMLYDHYHNTNYFNQKEFEQESKEYKVKETIII